MTNKFIKFIKINKWGALAGTLVGLGVATFYRLTGGDFMFAVADTQSRASGLSLTQQGVIGLSYITTIIGWIIIGALIGVFIDYKIGFKFSQKMKKSLLIITLLLFVYTIFAPLGITTLPDGSREAAPLTWFTTLSKSSGTFLTFLFFAITGLFGTIKGMFAPEPSIPIWIFFVAGFVFLLMFRKKGGGEQPIIIQR